MKKLNDKFGDIWKKQFQDAEITPGTAVWDRIDANLAGNQLSRYKKKLFYYKITAAASILLAILFGSYSLYHITRAPDIQQLVQQNQPDENRIASSDVESRSGNKGKIIPGEESTDNAENNLIADNEHVLNGVIDTDKRNTTDVRSEIASNENVLVSSASQSIKISSGSALQADELIVEKVSVDKALSGSLILAIQPPSRYNIPYSKPGRKYYLSKKINPFDLPYILPVEEEVVDTDPRRMWAGINFSSGIFDPNISYSGSPGISTDVSANTLGSVETIYSTSSDIKDQSSSIMSYKPEESSYKSDVSFSYGLDFGYKFSKRFVLLSGVGYQHNYGSTTVNTYVEPIASHSKYANHAIVIERANPDSGLNTYNELNSEVQLNSTFEFVSIPVNLGYYLIDKKFKWMMTAGLTTDIFIRNSINDSQNLFDKIQYRNGDDSPYNPIYINGKFGTMFNYTFLRNYQINLEPSYRIGLSDLTKEEATFISRPSSFIISAGIAYVF
jgi:hypothetical protein